MDHDRFVGAAGAGPRRHLWIVGDNDVQKAASVALDTVRESALALLTARPRTARELTTALTRKGADPDIAAEVLRRLISVGLVDDTAYARSYAERESGRRSPRAVADALQRRGIDPALAREVAFVGSAEEVHDAAREVARAALPRWRGLPAEVAQRRLAGLLARRGYSHGLVYAIVRDLLGDRDAHVDEVSADDGPAGVVPSTDAG